MEPLAPPLSDDDFVLRLIHENHFSKHRVFKVGSFGLFDHDTDGLSVYLERPDQASTERLLASKPKRHEFFVARIPVGVLRQTLGLRVEYTGHLDPNTPGHCSLPDITFPMSQNEATEAQVRERQHQLAHLVTTHPEYIVRRPVNPRCAA
jgi:hypothetical protein